MTSSNSRRDILLLGCRVVVYLLLVSFALALVLVVSVTIVGAVANPDLAQRMAGLNLTGIVMIGIALRFLWLLGRIVDSVAEEDPFSRANARRLHEMAWLALAFQLTALLIHWLGSDMRLVHTRGVTVLFSTGGGIYVHGVLLALVLLVLGRVFRKGADMRDELGATV